MYSNQLGEAVAALEAAFRRAPVALLQVGRRARVGHAVSEAGGPLRATCTP